MNIGVHGKKPHRLLTVLHLFTGSEVPLDCHENNSAAHSEAGGQKTIFAILTT